MVGLAGEGEAVVNRAKWHGLLWVLFGFWMLMTKDWTGFWACLVISGVWAAANWIVEELSE